MRLLSLFRCAHARTTFPQSPRGDVLQRKVSVVCLECGRELLYDWTRMRMVRGSLCVEQSGDLARKGPSVPLASPGSLR